MPRNSNAKTEYICCQCNRHYDSASQFFKTYSSLYSATGRLPMCRDCVTKLFSEYVTKYGSNRVAMKRICMVFDLYYSDALFDTCDDGTVASIGNYIKRLNMVQYKGKTFDTSIDEGFVFEDESRKSRSDSDNDEEVDEIDPVNIEKWGPGLGKNDYDVLNSHYKLLKTANPNCDINQEIFITDLCMTKMQQMKAVREGRVDDYNKLTESYRKSFQQAGLKTVRDANINEEFTIGVTAETIEKYTPAEYYKGKELYKDFDGIGEYIKRFLYRPLKNLQFGSKDRDHEFYVKDDDDENEYEEN